MSHAAKNVASGEQRLAVKPVRNVSLWMSTSSSCGRFSLRQRRFVGAWGSHYLPSIDVR